MKLTASLLVVFTLFYCTCAHVSYSNWRLIDTVCRRPNSGECAKAGTCCGKRLSGTQRLERDCEHDACPPDMLEKTQGCTIRCGDADATAYGAWVRAGNCERPSSGACAAEDTCCGQREGTMKHTRECNAANGCDAPTLERHFKCNVRCGFVNPCRLYPNPCENGGTCVEDGHSHSCTCASGWTGHHCDEDVDECASEPCQNGGTCTDGVNTYSCDCADGFSGGDCSTNVDECASEPCQNGGACTDGDNTYSCDCADGFSGGDCSTNVDECASEPCQNGGVCTDGDNTYSCDCADGFSGGDCSTTLADDTPAEEPVPPATPLCSDATWLQAGYAEGEDNTGDGYSPWNGGQLDSQEACYQTCIHMTRVYPDINAIGYGIEGRSAKSCSCYPASTGFKGEWKASDKLGAWGTNRVFCMMPEAEEKAAEEAATPLCTDSSWLEALYAEGEPFPGDGGYQSKYAGSPDSKEDCYQSCIRLKETYPEINAVKYGVEGINAGSCGCFPSVTSFKGEWKSPLGDWDTNEVFCMMPEATESKEEELIPGETCWVEGEQFMGTTVDTTADGSKCDMWSEDNLGWHFYDEDGNYDVDRYEPAIDDLDEGTAKNYCRNYMNDPNGPYCITGLEVEVDVSAAYTEIRKGNVLTTQEYFQYCGIPKCPNSEAPATCEPAITTLKKGTVKCSDGNKEGSTCELTCDQGYTCGEYEPHVHEVTCTNGAWSETPVEECIPKECPISYLENLEKSEGMESVTCLGGIEGMRNTMNARCDFKCKDGYEPSRRDLSDSCRIRLDGEVKEGWWYYGNDPLKCIKKPCEWGMTGENCDEFIECAEVDQVANAKPMDCTSGTTMISQSCTLECEDGYELVGNNEITCDIVDGQGVFDGTFGECKGKESKEEGLIPGKTCWKEGEQFMGTTVYTTASGKTCDNWDWDFNAWHMYDDNGDYDRNMYDAASNDLTDNTAANYCRNYKEDPNGPYCFVGATKADYDFVFTDISRNGNILSSQAHFEYCDIPKCP